MVTEHRGSVRRKELTFSVFLCVVAYDGQRMQKLLLKTLLFFLVCSLSATLENFASSTPEVMKAEVYRH